MSKVKPVKLEIVDHENGLLELRSLIPIAIAYQLEIDAIREVLNNLGNVEDDKVLLSEEYFNLKKEIKNTLNSLIVEKQKLTYDCLRRHKDTIIHVVSKIK